MHKKKKHSTGLTGKSFLFPVGTYYRKLYITTLSTSLSPRTKVPLNMYWYGVNTTSFLSAVGSHRFFYCVDLLTQIKALSVQKTFG